MSAAAACRVDFYVLESTSQSAETLACRLAMMSWEQGLRSIVLVPDEAAARRLDELMWEQPRGRFLPHEQVAQGNAAPVTIATPQLLGGAGGSLLINLTAQPVPEPGNYSRLLEFAPADEAGRSAARRKFAAYRKQGLEPASHAMKAT